MTVSIIANSAAKFAQSAIKTRDSSIAMNSQKISSGLRVFSASEDPASLAVGTGLKIENKGYAAALLNVSSGISMLQIADGALGQVSDILVRLQTLASQASSGQLDDASRALVDVEFQGLKSELDRIAQTTNFNGVKMLAGSKDFEVVTGSSLTADGIVQQTFDQTLVTGDQVFRYTYDSTTESLTVARVDGGAASSQTIDLSTLLDATAGQGQELKPGQTVQVGFSALGVTLTLDSTFVRSADLQPANTLTTGPDMTFAAPTAPTGATAPVFAAAGTGISLATVTALQDLTAGYDDTTGNLTLPITTDGTEVRLGAVAGISYVVNGGTATAAGAASDDLAGLGVDAVVDVYVDVAGSPVKLGTWTAGAIATTGTTSGSLVLGVGKDLVGADYIDDNGPTRLTYKVGIGVVNGQDTVAVTIPAVTQDALGLAGTDTLTAAGANSAIDVVRAALTTLSSARATVGAQQVRLEQVSANLAVLSENNERARSALLDVDISSEITDFTNNQAMLEASVAMLSKANQLPQMLLQLLRNG